MCESHKQSKIFRNDNKGSQYCSCTLTSVSFFKTSFDQKVSLFPLFAPSNSHSCYKQMFTVYIHPFASAYRFSGPWGALEPMPAVLGREGGYILDRSPV